MHCTALGFGVYKVVCVASYIGCTRDRNLIHLINWAYCTWASTQVKSKGRWNGRCNNYALIESNDIWEQDINFGQTKAFTYDLTWHNRWVSDRFMKHDWVASMQYKWLSGEGQSEQRNVNWSLKIKKVSMIACNKLLTTDTHIVIQMN